MDNCNNIDNLGVVVEVNDTNIEVLIQSNSACGACMAKNMCGMTESKPKRIVIKRKNGGIDGSSLYNRDFKIGDTVTVGLSITTGMRAARIAYLYPFILFILVLLYLTTKFENDLYAALISIGALSLYYLLLWVFNKTIGKQVKFYIQ